MSSEPQEFTGVMDFDSFRDRLGNDSLLILELIKLYQTDYPRQSDRVRKAAEMKDAVELCSAAHAVKGTVANFSAGPAGRAAEALEKMGASGDLSNVADGCRLLDYELHRLNGALIEFSSGEPK